MRLPSVQVTRASLTSKHGQETVAVKKLRKLAGGRQGGEGEDLSDELLTHSLMQHGGAGKIRGFLFRPNLKDARDRKIHVTGIILEYIPASPKKPASLHGYIHGFRRRHAADPSAPPIAPKPQRWSLLLQLLIALQKLHSKRKLHNDLKPDNVMLRHGEHGP